MVSSVQPPASAPAPIRPLAPAPRGPDLPRRARAFGAAALLGAAAFFLPGPSAAPLMAQGLTAPGAGAQPGALAQIVQATIRPGWRMADGQHMAALHLELAEGWRTYWRIPGQAGIAPHLDWSRSQNLARITPHWPRPEVFDQSGYRSIGYAHELILPLEIEPRRAGRPVALVGELTIGLCNEVCIPADLQVSIVLRGDGQHDRRIADALTTIAEPAGNAGLTGARCALTPDDRGASLTVHVTMPRLGRAEHMVLELPGTGLWVSDTRTRREGSDLVATARVMSPQRGAVAFGRDALTLTVISHDRMVEHRGCTAR